MDDLITAHEAAKLLHLHVKRVQQLARDGQLPAVRYGRKWLFHRARLVVDGVMAEVVIQIGDQSMVSIITRLEAEGGAW